jgi:Recombination endonuclease VII
MQKNHKLVSSDGCFLRMITGREAVRLVNAHRAGWRGQSSAFCSIVALLPEPSDLPLATKVDVAEANLASHIERRKKSKIVNAAPQFIDTRNEETKLLARSNTLKKYKLTLFEFDKLFESQGRSCAICGSSTPTDVHGWHLDHDHVTGKVRGILCGLCNTMLGMARDRIRVLEAAVVYLKTHSLL